MTVRVFVTGGTFDKEYNELTGELFVRNTHVEEILRRDPANRRARRSAGPSLASKGGTIRRGSVATSSGLSRINRAAS